MWTCPVCAQKSEASFCTRCGFDRSTHYELFPTLQTLPSSTPAASGLRKVYTQNSKASAHVSPALDLLTEFTIIAYRYAWIPETSRLEQQHKQFIHLGDARNFFNTTYWVPEKFAQTLPAAGEPLNISISYKYKGQRKTVKCTVPAIKCSDFWRIGVTLDASFQLTLFLGSGGQLARSMPVPLDLT